MNVRKALMVKPGQKVKLSDYDPDDTLGHEKGPRTDAKIEKACEPARTRCSICSTRRRNTRCWSCFKRSTPAEKTAPFAT